MAKKSSKGSGKPIPKIEMNWELSPDQREELLKTLRARFEKYGSRHNDLEWSRIRAKLEAHPEKLLSLAAMENTGGEPDVVGYDKQTGEYIFLIVQRKVLQAAEASVTMEKRSKKEKGKVFIHPVMRSISPLPWALSF